MNPERVATAGAIPGALPTGFVFGPYEILRPLGAGGMGVVYAVVHRGLNKRFALKTLHGVAVHHEPLRRRFEREARVAARVRHPNVVDITDVGVNAGTPFLVMELLDGEDLAALLRREGALSVGRAAELLVPIAAGLEALHRAGIVHRDMKPGNVFIARTALGGHEPKILRAARAQWLHRPPSRSRRLRARPPTTPTPRTDE